MRFLKRVKGYMRRGLIKSRRILKSIGGSMHLGILLS